MFASAVCETLECPPCWFSRTPLELVPFIAYESICKIKWRCWNGLQFRREYHQGINTVKSSISAAITGLCSRTAIQHVFDAPKLSAVTSGNPCRFMPYTLDDAQRSSTSSSGNKQISCVNWSVLRLRWPTEAIMTLVPNQNFRKLACFT